MKSLKSVFQKKKKGQAPPSAVVEIQAAGSNASTINIATNAGITNGSVSTFVVAANGASSS
ncbi:hypothetical protein CPC16_005290, partial [Podila verticillata]